MAPAARIRLKETSWNFPAGKIGILQLPADTNRYVFYFRFEDDHKDKVRVWLKSRFELAPKTSFYVRGALFRCVDQAIAHATSLARQYNCPVQVEPY